MQFTDLPLDIVDHILSFIPDFRTLAAAILTSKAHIFKSFQSHKQAILTSVALNLVGPSLPHAVATAVNVALSYEQIQNADFDERMTTTRDRLMSLTRESRTFLESSIPIMDKLEDIFSQMYAFSIFLSRCDRSTSFIRYKDRRSTTSVLTDEESLRLRRALYRIWLLSVCVNIVAMDGDDDDLDINSDFGDADEELRHIVVQYIAACLQQFDEQELVQLVAVTNFMITLEQRQTQISKFADQRLSSVFCLLYKFLLNALHRQQLIPPSTTSSHHHTRIIVRYSRRHPTLDG
jgi:hypothetical protein